ncbi:MAG: hypothetical protein ACKOC7_02970, partial [Sphingomonadales bacterium]
DLIVATQGRSVWIIDDLSMVQQHDNKIANKKLHVYHPNSTYRVAPTQNRWGGALSMPATAAANPPKGAVINFYSNTITDSTNASVAIYDAGGKEISRVTPQSKANPLKLNKGHNRVVWDLQYPGAEKADDLILWNGVPGTITAPPGNYFAVVTLDNDSIRVPLQLVADPNYRCSQEDYDAQFAFLQKVQGTFNETMKAIKQIRQARAQFNEFVQRQGKDCPKELSKLSDSLVKAITLIEEKLHQTKAKSGQDVLNYPIRLDDKLSGVFDMASSGNMAPPKQARDVYAVLAEQTEAATRQLKQLLDEGIGAFNTMVKEKGLPVIVLQ